jgi:hypothetical protein
MYKLGDQASSEALIKDLYINLRRQVNAWAAVTRQTAQARMGYIGQHLVSVVTGIPGGMTGARGYDLVLPNGCHAEIKTCYRVDQLGRCQNCDSPVASIEFECRACGSKHVVRKDDSKWLIGLRAEQDYAQMLDPVSYYFVLFEFEDINKPVNMVLSIYEVNPRRPGFAYALIDYRENIKSASKSGAPFNIWPHALKFTLMRPLLIYRSIVSVNDAISTKIFPNTGTAVEESMIDLNEFARASSLTPDSVQLACDRLQLGRLKGVGKRDLIADLAVRAKRANTAAGEFADALAYGLYRPKIERYLSTLPDALKGHLAQAGLL